MYVCVCVCLYVRDFAHVGQERTVVPPHTSFNIKNVFYSNSDSTAQSLDGTNPDLMLPDILAKVYGHEDFFLIFCFTTIIIHTTIVLHVTCSKRKTLFIL